MDRSPLENEQLRSKRVAQLDHLRRQLQNNVGCPLAEAGLLTEWFAAEPGQGAELISLWFAHQACQLHGGSLVIIDSNRCFYPPAAAAWGIPLDDLMLIRPPTADTFWVLDQAMRCAAIGAVWCAVTKLNDRWLRRFQLAVETSRCYAALVRPRSFYGRPSWSHMQFIVSSTSLPHTPPRWQIECVRKRKSSVLHDSLIDESRNRFELVADLQRGTLQTTTADRT